MRRRLPASFHLFLFCFLGAICAPGFAGPLATSLTTEERRNFQRETLVLIEFLQGYHYSDRPFHEVNAAELLERYFEALDPDRSIFLHGDTEFLRRRFERNLKTVYLFKGDLYPAFEIFDLFAKRMRERCAWIDSRLDRSFAFERDGTFNADRDEQPRPADAKTADTLWEDILQNELVNERVVGRAREDAVAEVRRRYVEKRQHTETADPLRVREIFLNALMGLFDPHCGYFSKETADEVSGDLTGAVTGIGVDLRSSEGKFLVKSLQPGGPAERAGTIHPGDEFIAVSENGQPAQPLARRRLREIVEMIRGKPGTKLALTIRPASGGDEKIVELERSRMEIADNHASGLLYRVPGENGAAPVAIGVVTLPAFYGENEKGATAASMTKDVAELLGKFSARGAEAVVIDLRDNGGGLINEAVGLAGLFIEKGPALLTRGKSGQPTILRDEDPSIAFAGPLVVLTSRHSASASEGFSGAMQAYRRALIVGEVTTFGKGTMQWFVDLGKTMTSIDESVRAQWGVARVTREFFYFPDGNSPQSDGVVSDIALPAATHPRDLREKDMPHALPHTRIPAPEPLDVTSPTVARLDPATLDQLRAAFQKRRNALPEFVLETKVDALRQQLWKSGPAPLRLSARQGEYDELNRQRLELRAARRQLDATAAFSVERVDLDVVIENRRAHQAVLAARKTTDGASFANHLERETFYYRASEESEIRAVPLDKIDWSVALAQASTLAKTWSVTTGHAADEAAIQQVLVALKLRDPDSPAVVGVPEIFRQHLGDSLDAPTLQIAMNAFLKTAAEIDIDALQDQRPLDVRLRESLRLAADWVRLRTAAPTTP